MPRPTTTEEYRLFRELVEQHGLGGALAFRFLVVVTFFALIAIPMLLHERVFQSRRGALWLALVPVLGAAVCAVALVLIGLAIGYWVDWARVGFGALGGAGLELLYVVPAAVALVWRRYVSNNRPWRDRG